MSDNENLIHAATVKAFKYVTENYPDDTIKTQQLLCKIYIEGFIQGVISR